jgi:hypothetical protein
VLASQASFFHWELAFPEVFRPAGGKAGGFDVVLGNPPWDQVQLDPGEYFAKKFPAISAAPNMAAKERLIEQLKIEELGLYADYIRDLNNVEALQSFVHGSGRYPLTSYGRLNLAPLFAELARALVSTEGRIGIIVPSGIATDSFNQYFFQDLVKKRNIVCLYDFENREGLFPGVDSRMKFCLLTLSGRDLGKTWKSRFVFFAHSVQELEDAERQIRLSEEDFVRINPNTMTCPIFRNKRDAELTKAICSRVPVLVNEGMGEAGSPWAFKGLLMFMMNTGSRIFRNQSSLRSDGFRLSGTSFQKGKELWVPLYEAKMMHNFDYRWATYDGTDARDVTEAEKKNENFEVMPRYWVPESEVAARLEGRWNHEWLIGWRDICRSTDERTVIASVVPKTAAGDTFLLMLPQQPNAWLLVSNLNAYCLDFFARQKIGGTHLKFHVFYQLPIFPPSAYSVPCPWERSAGTVADWIKPRVLELVYTSHSLEPFARDLGYTGAPFAWDSERRFSLRCELDAAFFHLYGIGADDADYILETFPIVKRHDEQEFGEYRTKRVILERYDEYAKAIRRNNPEGFTLDLGMTQKLAHGDFPAVPALLTLSGLLEYLARLGVEVDNKRGVGGSLWVYRSKAEFGKLAEHLEKSGVGVKFYPEGRKSRAGEQWEVDPGKRLG